MRAIRRLAGLVVAAVTALAVSAVQSTAPYASRYVRPSTETSSTEVFTGTTEAKEELAANNSISDRQVCLA